MRLPKSTGRRSAKPPRLYGRSLNKKTSRLLEKKIAKFAKVDNTRNHSRVGISSPPTSYCETTAENGDPFNSMKVMFYLTLGSSVFSNIGYAEAKIEFRLIRLVRFLNYYDTSPIPLSRRKLTSVTIFIIDCGIHYFFILIIRWIGIQDIMKLVEGSPKRDCLVPSLTL